MTPEASVVIPAYNAARWIEVMLASLDAQIDPPAFEVIVADNGSTDDTVERVRAWSVGHARVRLVDASGTQGASHARNEGIRAAASDRILMCDADDAVSRHWVRLLSDALADHRYAAGPTVRWPFEHEPTSGTWPADLQATAPDHDDAEVAALQGIPFAPAGNCAIRREVIVEAGGWDESLLTHEDPELALRLLRRGIRVHRVEDAVIYYRQRHGVIDTLRDHVHYALPRAGIVSQYADLGLQGSVRSAARDTVGAIPSPRLWRSREMRRNQAARLGDNIGFIVGWVRDRITPRLPMTPLAVPPDTPPAVVFVADQLIRPNGILSSIEILAEGFAAAGVPVTIVHEGRADARVAASFPTFDQKPGWRLTTEMRDYPHSRPLLKPLRRLFTAVLWRPWTRRRNRAFLRSLPPRTLVVGAGLAATSFLMEGRAQDLVLVAQVHLSVAALEPGVLELVDDVAGWSDAVTALTEEDAEQLRSRGVEGCVAMPNPIRIPDRVPPMRDREHLVVYIGRLGAEKQVEQAIEAFARASRDDWRLEVYGQGPMEASLARVAAGAGADVALMGTVTDVASVLRRSSLNILASRAEGLPMSVLEAGAHGVPTVAYDSAPGVRQAVGPGGVLTAVGDLDGLVENLSELMGDEARRETLANAAVDHARQFSADRLVGRWAGLWRSVVRAEDPKKVR